MKRYAWIEYLRANKDRFLSEIMEFLKVPSIRADLGYKSSILKCSQLVRQRLHDSGCDRAEIMPANGHPVVYGEKIIDMQELTVLVNIGIWPL